MANSIVDPRDPNYCDACSGECVCGAVATPSAISPCDGEGPYDDDYTPPCDCVACVGLKEN